MTDIGRGLSLEQAKQIAADPRSAASVLTRLANNYPEVWHILLTNPSTPSELHMWLENAMRPKAPAPDASPVLKPDTSGDTSTVARPVRRTPSEKSPVSSPLPTPSAPATGRAPAVARPPKRRSARTKRGKTVTVVASIAVLAVLATISAWTLSLAKPPGQIVTQELADAPTASAGWTYDLLRGQENDSCIEWSFQSFSQDIAVVLSQYAKEKDGCDDLEKPPASFLALVNLTTGKDVWREDLAKVLPWTADWKKELIDFAGLNEIVLMFTDTPDDPEADAKKTLVPFSRLDGSVTDPAISGNKNDPTSSAPELSVGRLPDTDKNLIIGFPASEDEGKLSYRRVKKLATSSKWTTKIDLEPLSGNPIVGDHIIVGSEYDDAPQAVALDDGKVSDWPGPAGGKQYDIAGSYVHVSGDGSDMKYSNSPSQDGKAETSDCDAECITLTGLSAKGKVLWERKVPGYAVARDSSTVTNADRGQFSTLFIVSSDRHYAMPINPRTGEPRWDEAQDWGDFEVARTDTYGSFFTYSTSTDADHSDGLQMRDIRSGGVLAEFAIPNDQTRIDGVSTHFAYVVDEPDRQAVVDDLESGDSASSSSDDGEDKSDETRVCMWAIDLRSGQKSWEWKCNGNQHVVLMAGRWVVLDKTSGAQTLRPLLVEG